MTVGAESFLSERRRGTPCLVVDLAQVERAYGELVRVLPRTRIHYAVKANPAAPIVERLASLGASFDVASRHEIRTCMRVGVDATRLSYGHTVKKSVDIAWAFRQGLRRFSFDSDAELEKLAHRAPGSFVSCRLLVDNTGASWPLARKFGCSPEVAVELMSKAEQLGLHPTGLSFHVGSQQADPARWDPAVALATEVSARLAETGIEVSFLNVGGGFPVRYDVAVPGPEAFAQAIEESLARHFGNRIPDILLESGRYLVAEAGVIETEVVLVSRKSPDDARRWVYLDIGRFGGLAETEGEAIRYQIETPAVNGPAGPVVIAGPTCDGADVLYDRADYRMPLALVSGDRVRIRSAGAYTNVYASDFNGLPRIRTHFV